MGLFGWLDGKGGGRGHEKWSVWTGRAGRVGGGGVEKWREGTGSVWCGGAGVVVGGGGGEVVCVWGGGGGGLGTLILRLNETKNLNSVRED